MFQVIEVDRQVKNEGTLATGAYLGGITYHSFSLTPRRDSSALQVRKYLFIMKSVGAIGWRRTINPFLEEAT